MGGGKGSRAPDCLRSYYSAYQDAGSLFFPSVLVRFFVYPVCFHSNSLSPQNSTCEFLYFLKVKKQKTYRSPRMYKGACL